MRNAVRATEDHFGKVDILVNNAGIWKRAAGQRASGALNLIMHRPVPLTNRSVQTRINILPYEGFLNGDIVTHEAMTSFFTYMISRGVVRMERDANQRRGRRVTDISGQEVDAE